MPVPSEETIEAETGLGYSFDLDYSYGVDESGEPGSVTAASASPITATESVVSTEPGSTTAATATPVTAADFLIAADTGATAAATASPITATDFLIAAESGSVTATSASPLTATDFFIAADSGSTTAATATPLAVALRRWHVDGRAITAGGLSADPQTISLSFEISNDELSTWRRYDRAGDISIRTGFGGSFRAIDRGGRSGPRTVEPPADQSPPFAETDGYVSGYDETPLSADRTQVTISFQRASNRTSQFSAVSESGDWELAFDSGTVAVGGEHVGPTPSQGSATGPQRSLSLALADDQAATVLDNVGYPAGVVERPAPDGADGLVDESSNARQTVSISAPSRATLSDGDYYVVGWSIDDRGFRPSRRWAVTLTLRPT